MIKTILFSMFLMCTYHSGLKVHVSGFAGEIAKFEIDNARLIDPAGARITPHHFIELIFEGIREHNPEYQFDPNLAKLVEGEAELARVPADDEEVRIKLGKVQPKYRVFHHLGCRVKINDLIFNLLASEEQLRGGQEYELSELGNYNIMSVSYGDIHDIHNFLEFFIDDPLVGAKLNERTVQVLTAIKDFVKLCKDNDRDLYRYNCAILKAFELAGIGSTEFHPLQQTSHTSKEDEETIKGLLNAQGLLIQPIT